MPKVSVIVPSYQQGRFLRYTLDSVLSQDFRDLECLVIDGGSTDETIDVLRSYNDDRLHWVSEKDSGQSDAINKGLGMASGEFLTYLNSDDLLLPGAISAVIGAFEPNSQADIIYGDMRFIDADGTTRQHFEGRPFDLEEALSGHNPISQPGTFWRRRVTQRIGLMADDMHFCMDLDYWIRAYFDGFQLVYVPGERSAFRVHDESKTVARTNGFVNDWNAILGRIERDPSSDAATKALVRRSRGAFSFLWAREYWRQGKRQEAVPLLRVVLSADRRPTHLIGALLMLIDARTGANVSGVVKKVAGSLRGG